MDWFGLGIMLNARDNASQSILRVNQAFTTLTDNLGRTSATVSTEVSAIQSQLNSLSQNIMVGLGMQQLGESMLNFSGSIMKPITEITNQTVKTGAQFEQWRMTLKALYKDADLAKQKLDWGLDMASRTPFEVPDVTQALIGFKAMGVEADTILKSSEGIEQSMLEFIGDLAALRPDVGLNGVMMGVRNLMGGDGGKSLKMRLDLPLEEILGREFSDSTDGLMQDLADLSSKVANGLMGELEGTWEQMISNLKDQSTRFFLAIADNGAFDKAKSTLSYLSEAINKVDDEKLKAIGTNIASAFEMIWKPVDFVIRKLVDFGSAIVEILATNPAITKIVTTFVALLGGITAVMGVLLVLGGTFLIAVNGIKLFIMSLSGLKGTLLFIGGAIKGVMLTMAKFALIGGLVYGAWKTDFGGVRTMLQNFMKNMQTAFSYSTDIVNMSASDMARALEELDKTTFTGWLTYRLVQIKTLWKGLCDAWNDYTLSDENFEKLRITGMLPLLETILDLKLRVEAFWEGFKKGFESASKVVTKVIKVIGDSLEKLLTTKLFPIKDSVDEITEATGKIDLSGWEKFGEVLGVIAPILATILIVGKVIGVIVKIVTVIGSAISSIISFAVSIGKVLLGIGKFVGGVLTVIGSVVSAILGFCGFVTTLPAWLIGLITTAIAGLVALIVKNWNAIVDFTKKIWGHIVNFLAGIWQKIKDIFSVVGGWFSGLWQGVCDITSDIWNGIVSFFNSIINTIQSAWNTMLNFFSGLWQGVCNIAIGIWNWIQSVINNVVGVIVSVWNTITGFFSGLWQGVSNVTSSVWGGISSFISGIFNTVSGVWNGITGVFSNIWQSVKNTATSFFNWLGSKFQWVTNAIQSVSGAFNGIKNGISNGVSGLVSSAKKLVGLNTGGYVKTEGIAMLHPNEVVVNDEITQGLRTFLNERDKETPLNPNMIPQQNIQNIEVKPIVQNSTPSATPVTRNVNNNEEVYNSVSNANTYNNSRSTDNSSNQTTTDNSVTFSEGAIQVTLTNGGEADVEKLFKEISKRLKKEQSLRSTLNYRPVLG